jgi:hypothetical protein
VQSDYPESPWVAYAILGEAKVWAREWEWEQAQAALDRLAAANPPEKLAKEARKLGESVKQHLASSRGGAAPPASAP